MLIISQKNSLQMREYLKVFHYMIQRICGELEVLRISLYSQDSKIFVLCYYIETILLLTKLNQLDVITMFVVLVISLCQFLVEEENLVACD